MFRFEREQLIYGIHNVRVGGQPGQLPPVMVGSIFYSGHKVVEDERVGLFDRKRAEELLRLEEEYSRTTGLPRIIDVVGNYSTALLKYIDFVADVVEDPFLLDGITAQVRIEALKHVKEVGLARRVVYNSIAATYEAAEVEALKDSGVKTAVLQVLNMRNPTVQGRLEVLRDTGRGRGLISVAKEAGVDQLLVDTSVLDTADIGVASQTIYEVKRETGLPSGCGPANAMSPWKQLRKFEPEVLRSCDVVSQAFPLTMGANFILYGPVSNARHVYPACALVAAYIAYSMRFQGVRPLTQEHPLFKVIR